MNTQEGLLSTLPASGWSRITRLPLIHREVKESLSAAALDLILARAEWVVEGGIENQAQNLEGQKPRVPGERKGEATFPERIYLTVMGTLDLERLAEQLRDPVDPVTATRVAELMDQDTRVGDRLIQIAKRRWKQVVVAKNGGRVTNGDFGITNKIRFEIEHTAKAEGCKVLLDGDVLGRVSRRSRKATSTLVAVGNGAASVLKPKEGRWG